MIDKIEADLKTAMLGGDKIKVSVLKLFKSSLANKRIETGKDLTDEEIQAVLRTEAKKRVEAIEMYEKGDKQEAADKEKTELEIIEGYLPKQMDDGELAKLVDDVKSALGEGAHVGQIIQETIKRSKGRADGKRVSALVMKP